MQIHHTKTINSVLVQFVSYDAGDKPLVADEPHLCTTPDGVVRSFKTQSAARQFALGFTGSLPNPVDEPVEAPTPPTNPVDEPVEAPTPKPTKKVKPTKKGKKAGGFKIPK